MAWETYKVEEQRRQLVLAYIRKDATMTALCDHYGVSTKTGYKYYSLYDCNPYPIRKATCLSCN